MLLKTFNRHYSKSYRPMAPIQLYTIHPVIVPLNTNFQLSSFHSSWEICYKKIQKWQNLKTYKGTELQDLLVLGHQPAITLPLLHRPRVV